MPASASGARVEYFYFSVVFFFLASWGFAAGFGEKVWWELSCEIRDGCEGVVPGAAVV